MTATSAIPSLRQIALKSEKVVWFIQARVPPDVAVRATPEISGCEACSADAEIPLDWVLCELMDRLGMFEFILSAPVRCPLCHGPVTEKTLVDRVGGMEVPA